LKEIEFGAPHPDKIEEPYRIDSDLIWVPKSYYDELNHYRRFNPSMVSMGCSCTEKGAYQHHFSNAVRSILGRDIVYANFGVEGWSSHQGLKQIKRDVWTVYPKIVTIYFGWNDHWIGFGFEDKDITKYNSLFYPYKDIRLAQLLTKTWIASINRSYHPERVSPEDFKRNITEMVTFAREKGIVPILLTAPTSHKPGEEPAYLAERWLRTLEDLVPLHQEYVSIIRTVSEEKSVHLCDLEKEFKVFLKGKAESEYFEKDGIHLKDKGYRLIAKSLFRFFIDNNLFDIVS
jgi:lysophospholipase L1-like esterase